MKFQEKVALVTGSGRGIGREIARRFAAGGAKVVIAEIDRAAGQAAASALGAAEGRALAVAMDVADPASVRRAVAEAADRFGRIDILVNNAGVGLNKPFLTTTSEEWEGVLRVNLTGTFNCSQAVARLMAGQKSGRIVNVASISGQRGGIGRSAYGASKAGVIMLTRVMATELAPLGIAVNAVAPGPVVTDQSRGTHTAATTRSYLERIPLKRYGTVEEIAAGVVFLASEEASFIQGAILNVDGGFDAAGLIFEQEA